MFRKRDGSLGFSFGRFINNAMPNLAADPHREDNIPNLGPDMLYGHQLNTVGPNAPYALDERSLQASGICESDSLSSKLLGKLKSSGLVTEEGFVDTRNLDGKKFAHQVAVISQTRQKDLINLLFWWEEECMRLRKLVADEKHLDEQIKTLEAGVYSMEESVFDDDQERRQLIDQLKFEREKLRMRIRQKPSERRQDIESGTERLFVLPQSETASTTNPPSYRP